MTLNDEIVGFEGACKYQDYGRVMSIAEVPDCFDVNECLAECHPITDKWGACYVDDSSDAANENDWRWVTGESSVVGQDMVYANWYAAEPDDCCGGQDCASISGGHWGYKWNDNKCHFLLPYMCE